jgi:hypothetical protein
VARTHLPVRITVKGGQNAAARTLGVLAGLAVWLIVPFGALWSGSTSDAVTRARLRRYRNVRQSSGGVAANGRKDQRS